MWGSGKGGNEKWIGYNAVNDIKETNLSVINLAKTALVRQPYSVAVPSTGGRLHPLPFWKGRGLGCELRTLPLGRDRWGKNSTRGRLHPLVPEVSVPR